MVYDTIAAAPNGAASPGAQRTSAPPYGGVLPCLGLRAGQYQVGVEKTPFVHDSNVGRDTLLAIAPRCAQRAPAHLIIVSFDLVLNTLRRHRRPAALPFVEPSGVTGPLDPRPRAGTRRPVETGAVALMHVGPGRSLACSHASDPPPSSSTPAAPCHGFGVFGALCRVRSMLFADAVSHQGGYCGPTRAARWYRIPHPILILKLPQNSLALRLACVITGGYFGGRI